MITFENEKEVRLTLYVMKLTLSGVCNQVEEIIQHYEEGRLLNYELNEMEMSSGLPRLDYGQTVNLRFRKTDYTRNLEKSGRLPKNKVIVGS